MPGDRPLRREDMTPMAVLPAKLKTTEEVTRQLTEVAKKPGRPLCVVCDGASELHESVEQLSSGDFEVVCIDDVKHKIANVLKKTLGKDERFVQFEARVGKMTALLQQTELDHLVPPRKKSKSRFMNLDKFIDWATMSEHQLVEHQSVEDPENERLQEKLGWLAEFKEDVVRWRQIREIIGQTLKQTNTHGLFLGSTAQLEATLAPLKPASEVKPASKVKPTSEAENELVTRIHRDVIAISQANEDKLRFLIQQRAFKKMDNRALRVPCSTEVLESAFGRYKAVQGDHGRAFTSLRASFPTLFDDCTPEKIARRFIKVSNANLDNWIQDMKLTNSTQSRRTRAYNKLKAKPKKNVTACQTTT